MEKSNTTFSFCIFKFKTVFFSNSKTISYLSLFNK